MTVLTPIFHAILTAVNVYLVIFNYKRDVIIDAGVHLLFVINFFIMFLITSGEYASGRKTDKLE
jgi:hypothetical protein